MEYGNAFENCHTQGNLFNTEESQEYVPQFQDEQQDRQKKRANLWEVINKTGSIEQDMSGTLTSTNEVNECGLFFYYQTMLKKHRRESTVLIKSKPAALIKKDQQKTLQVFLQKMNLGTLNLTMTTVRDMSKVLEL